MALGCENGSVDRFSTPTKTNSHKKSRPHDGRLKDSGYSEGRARTREKLHYRIGGHLAWPIQLARPSLIAGRNFFPALHPSFIHIGPTGRRFVNSATSPPLPRHTHVALTLSLRTQQPFDYFGGAPALLRPDFTDVLVRMARETCS